MTIQELLKESRAIWGSRKMNLEEIVIAGGVLNGDIHRYARDKHEGRPVNEDKLRKELGNSILSTIRWCDDLGFDPIDCIELAKQAQRAYQNRT